MIKICKVCSSEFETNFHCSKYCKTCAKVVMKKQQKQYWERNKRVKVTQEEVIEGNTDLTFRMNPDILFAIQNDCKRLKKGLVEREFILKKWDRLNRDKLDKYIDRCIN